LTTILLCENS